MTQESEHNMALVQLSMSQRDDILHERIDSILHKVRVDDLQEDIDCRSSLQSYR